MPIKKKKKTDSTPIYIILLLADMEQKVFYIGAWSWSMQRFVFVQADVKKKVRQAAIKAKLAIMAPNFF